ncbi:MAG TPA: alpha/beta hydrolase [Desulfobacterales bacterium]|nr:alpha/beta hydrolase [Desulfobacterales bacterium]
MREKGVFIENDAYRLEGMLYEGEKKGVIVTHPHPLYGGNMNNNVVEAIVRAYQGANFTTLRFNFRGVGESEGRHEGGGGEQRDVEAAIRYLKNLGISELHLAGYSFGAWVNAMGIKRYTEVEVFVMISPPVAFLDYSTATHEPRIRFVITGSNDQIAPPHLVKDLVEKWNPRARFVIIKGCDHFYWGKEQELIKFLNEFVRGKAD